MNVYLATKLIATGNGFILRDPRRYSFIIFDPNWIGFFAVLAPWVVSTSSFSFFLLFLEYANELWFDEQFLISSLDETTHLMKPKYPPDVAENINIAANTQ